MQGYQVHMLLQEYVDIASEDQGGARTSERELLGQIIAAMEASDSQPENLVQRVQSIHFVRQVWGYFLNDLASEDNAMPANNRLICWIRG